MKKAMRSGLGFESNKRHGFGAYTRKNLTNEGQNEIRERTLEMARTKYGLKGSDDEMMYAMYS